MLCKLNIITLIFITILSNGFCSTINLSDDFDKCSVVTSRQSTDDLHINNLNNLPREILKDVIHNITNPCDIISFAATNKKNAIFIENLINERRLVKFLTDLSITSFSNSKDYENSLQTVFQIVYDRIYLKLRNMLDPNPKKKNAEKTNVLQLIGQPLIFKCLHENLSVIDHSAVKTIIKNIYNDHKDEIINPLENYVEKDFFVTLNYNVKTVPFLKACNKLNIKIKIEN